MDLRLCTFCSELELIPTDIMPMINAAWDISFADFDKNEKAIAATRWNPLTKCLILYPVLQRSMYDCNYGQELDIGLVTKKA